MSPKLELNLPSSAEIFHLDKLKCIQTKCDICSLVSLKFTDPRSVAVDTLRVRRSPIAVPCEVDCSGYSVVFIKILNRRELKCPVQKGTV